MQYKHCIVVVVTAMIVIGIILRSSLLVSQFCSPCQIFISYKIAGLSTSLQDKDWLCICFKNSSALSILQTASNHLIAIVN